MSSPATPQTKVLVDTTVLTDALLKPTGEGPVARAAVARYSDSSLPQYAIKEFKAGPLRNYVWFYNKVLACPRLEDAIQAISSVWRQSNKMRTAIRALADFESSIGKRMPDDLKKRYPGQTEGEIRRAEAEIWLRTLILLAWKRRRKLTNRVVAPLSCYPERDPVVLANGRIDDRPVVCGVEDCCLRDTFTRSGEVRQLLEACDLLPQKEETQKRRKALRQLYRFPDRDLSEKECRALGDAVFAVQCPKDTVILTTNIADHQPLASAVGVSAVRP